MHTSHDLMKALSKPVDVKKLISKLAFDLDDLETASLEQPTLRLRAGRLQTQMMLRKFEYKRKFSVVTGEKSRHIRHKHGTTFKATAIKNELGCDRRVQRAQKALDEAEALEAYAKELNMSYTERSKTLFNLFGLRKSEMSSELRAAKGQAEVDVLRDKARKMRDKWEEEHYE